MSDRAPSDVIGFKVQLGGGRSPERVIGRLIYGDKPKWLSGRGFTSSLLGKSMVTVSLFGHGAAQVCCDSLNCYGLIVYPADECARIVAEGLAGKVGTVRPYTHGEWCDDYAIYNARTNGEPEPERRYTVTEVHK